ncbi:hypothetical protein Tco_0991159 [Tanacetum coccineum]|uniref:Uncharacterized protein n=1 Tax=Tanacetum coccineum TaxID=301880 RepID=A0ABQ5EYS1_9ASTR
MTWDGADDDQEPSAGQTGGAKEEGRKEPEFTVLKEKQQPDSRTRLYGSKTPKALLSNLLRYVHDEQAEGRGSIIPDGFYQPKRLPS